MWDPQSTTPTHVARQSGTVAPGALARPKGLWDAICFLKRLILKYLLKKGLKIKNYPEEPESIVFLLLRESPL
jgi:hypothetical protein